MFGFLNVYKPIGKTSHDVVAYFRKILKIKKIAHTGTLDPFAEGVLPICIGKATKLIEYLPDDKAYLAFVKFGKATDTYDNEGTITFSTDKKITKDEIQEKLALFEGEIEQLPPIYSAIKVKGKKLYEYAREGEKVEINARKITIYNIELKNFDFDNQIAEIYIECSKGTYIRSIANDVGKILGCGGYLDRLIRTKAGKFIVENSIKMEDFNNQDIIKEKLINPINMLNLQTYNLTELELKKVLHGQPFLNKNIKCVDFIILVYNNCIKAVGKADGNYIKVNKVFDNA